MSVDAQGNITFDFTGHVGAQGIDLIASTAVSPPVDRRIAWHETTLNGRKCFEAYGSDFTGFTNGTLNAFSADGTLASTIDIQQADGANDGNTRIALVAGATSISRRQFWAIDALDRSSALRFAANDIRTHKIEYGSFPFVWNGTNNMTFLVNHNLGVQPIIALANQGNNNTVDLLRVFPGSPGGVTQFTINVLANVNFGGGGGGVPAAGTNDNIQWLAIG